MSGLVTLLAVDPGTSGGIAWETENGIRAVNMPEDRTEILRTIAEIAEGGMCRAFIERVGGYIKPKKTQVNAPGEPESFRLEDQSHLMFNFGKNYGRWLGILETNYIVTEEVAPQSWQKDLELKRAGRGRAEWKNLLKWKAQQLYPNMKVTLGTADALLILYYAQGKMRPKPPALDPQRKLL